MSHFIDTDLTVDLSDAIIRKITQMSGLQFVNWVVVESQKRVVKLLVFDFKWP